jgi:hypothetical protein
MRKVTLEINNSIYDYIMFFLENIPKNLVSIKKEIQSKAHNSNELLQDTFNPRDFFGVANSSKTDIDNYLKQDKDEWDSYIDER